MKSEVEIFYDAVRAKWPNPTKPWNELTQMEQIHIIQGINMILSVLP